MIFFEGAEDPALRSTVHPLSGSISDLRWKDPEHVEAGDFVLTERGWLRSYSHLYASMKALGSFHLQLKGGGLIELPRLYWNHGSNPVICVGYTDHSLALDAELSEIHRISKVPLEELRPGDAVQLGYSWQVVDRFRIPDNPSQVNLKRRKNRPMGELFGRDGTIDQFELQLISQSYGAPLVEVRRDLAPEDLGFESSRVKLAMGEYSYNSPKEGVQR